MEAKNISDGMAAGRIDPATVPQRTLSTGARMPAIGLGTFGSDHVSAAQIAEADKSAALSNARQKVAHLYQRALRRP